MIAFLPSRHLFSAVVIVAAALQSTAYGLPDEARLLLSGVQPREAEGLAGSNSFFLSAPESAYPSWFLNALRNPARTQMVNPRLPELSYDRAGDRPESSSAYELLGPANFDTVSFFNVASLYRSRYLDVGAPSALTAIKQFDGGSGGTGNAWGFDPNWAPDGIPTATDDVQFDNDFVATLPNIHLGGGSRVANSLALALTTDQSWSLGAAATGTTSFSATLTLTTGIIKRSNTTNEQLNIIGATSGVGLQGVTTLATAASGFTITNQSNNGILEIDAIISGATKTVALDGVGTVVFGGANTYTGTTTVSHGTLLISGDQSAATGAVSVKNMGTVLGGDGTIGGAVTVSDGASITAATNGIVGTLTLNSNLTFSATNATIGTYLVDLAGSGSSDKLVIAGILDLSGALDHLTLNDIPDGSSTYTLATYSSVSGIFDVTNVPANYQLIYGDTGLLLAPVPEPATWIGGALALGAIAFVSRRKLGAAIAAL
jgi:autotransporter-associated beta strand protein